MQFVGTQVLGESLVVAGPDLTDVGCPGILVEDLADALGRDRALRAEAGDSELAVSAALPLVNVAAQLGELELLYPRREEHRTVRS